MERLFTPWRKNYILQENNNKMKDKKCVFCHIHSQSPQEDPENLILFRSKLAFIMLNKYPYNSGHIMVLPYEHEGDLTLLSNEVRNEIINLTSLAVDTLKKVYHPMSFNMGINMGKAAGGSISEHIHMHIVPRWEGDTNFMPIIGNIKTLPEGLEESYIKIKPVMEKIAADISYSLESRDMNR